MKNWWDDDFIIHDGDSNELNGKDNIFCFEGKIYVNGEIQVEEDDVSEELKDVAQDIETHYTGFADQLRLMRECEGMSWLDSVIITPDNDGLKASNTDSLYIDETTRTKYKKVVRTHYESLEDGSIVEEDNIIVNRFKVSE